MTTTRTTTALKTYDGTPPPRITTIETCLNDMSITNATPTVAVAHADWRGTMSPKHDAFTNLHVHSDHSKLDGLAHVSDYFERAAELGQPALSLTEHANMFSAYSAYQASKRTGVKWIAGMEAYIA